MQNNRFKTISKFFLIGLFVLISTGLKSQVLEPVKWKFSVKELSNDEAELIFTANVDDTWHIYSQTLPPTAFEMPTVFEFDKSDKYKRLGKVSEPTGKTYYDEDADAEIRIHEKTVVFKQKIKKLSKDNFTITGLVDAQACQDGKCVPVKEDFSFSLSGAEAEVSAEEIAMIEEQEEAEEQEDSEADLISAEDDFVIDASNPADSDSLWGFFILAFVLGLAAILTPCVFPMIPMTVTFFMKSGKRGKFNAMMYGLSIIAIYVLFGSVLAVVFGEDFGNWISTHWIPNVLFFLIFIFFAAAFFGYFELKMPSWLVNKSVANEDRGGIIGSIFMALTLVLVSFSCTGPIVGTIVVASAGGQVLKPIIGMLGFSLAFALPFTLFALFPGWLQKMPKSGGWLNTVKVFLGFIELAFALKFLNVPDQTYGWGILDREVYLSFWIVIFILLGLYLIGKIRFPHDSESPHIKSFPRLSLAIISFAFAVYMIPGLWGAPLKALSGWLPPMDTQDFDITNIVREHSGEKTVNICDEPRWADRGLKIPHGIKGYFDLDQAKACAKELNKPVFIDFTGHGCTNCREMESSVWSRPEALNLLENEFVVVALYVDNKNIQLPEEEWYTNEKGRLIKMLGDKNSDIQITEFNQNAQPYYVIIDADGNMMNTPQFYNLNPSVFINFLKEGLENFNKKNR